MYSRAISFTKREANDRCNADVFGRGDEDDFSPSRTSARLLKWGDVQGIEVEERHLEEVTLMFSDFFMTVTLVYCRKLFII